jgi:hypothetical protein
MVPLTSQDGDDRRAFGFLPPNVAKHSLWGPLMAAAVQRTPTAVSLSTCPHASADGGVRDHWPPVIVALYEAPFTRGGPTWYAAATGRGVSTRPGGRGGLREVPRAIRNGCGHRRHGVQTSRHVPQGHPCPLRLPSVEDHAVKEGP